MLAQQEDTVMPQQCPQQFYALKVTTVHQELFFHLPAQQENIIPTLEVPPLLLE